MREIDVERMSNYEWPYKNKDVLSTDDLVKLYHSHGVNFIFRSSLSCRKNNFQSSKVTAMNKLLRNAFGPLGFYFIDNSRACNHLLSNGIDLNYGGTNNFCESAAFCLNNFFYEIRQANIINHVINLIY